MTNDAYKTPERCEITRAQSSSLCCDRRTRARLVILASRLRDDGSSYVGRLGKKPVRENNNWYERRAAHLHTSVHVGAFTFAENGGRIERARERLSLGGHLHRLDLFFLFFFFVQRHYVNAHFASREPTVFIARSAPIFTVTRLVNLDVTPILQRAVTPNA